MTGFSETQIADLEAPLAREHVKQREQAGRKFSYVEGWHVIAEANRIFGFDGWDRETVETRCVAEAEVTLGQGTNRERPGWRVGYTAKVRVTVRAGEVIVRREGCGFGSGIDADLGSAHESAIKEAETDAWKRAVMTFGAPLGLALYDKEQANVEAPQRQERRDPLPRAATRDAPSAGAAPSASSNTGSRGNGTLAPRTPREARDAIRAAIEKADTAKQIDDIITLNTADLVRIRAAKNGVPAYDELMQFANVRKGELRASV